VSDGLIMNRALASWNEVDNPGIKVALDIMAKNNRESKMMVSGYLSGLEGMYLACEALNSAVKAVGWDKLDGKAIKDQFEQFRNFDILGLGTYTITPDKHEPTTVRIYQVQGGKIIPITDYMTCPDLRPYKY